MTEQTNIANNTSAKKYEPPFVVFVLLFLVMPFVGMLWAPTLATTENRSLADAPELFKDNGALNENFLADAGTYFEDHFAYRNEMVSANAHLRAMLGTSATDQVVVGSNGWLYYIGTLPDYLGQSALSERELRNIAHNMKLLQGFAQAYGAEFIFAVAPNKNSLYPQHMPTRYLQVSEPGNWQRLVPYLDEYGVAYADLFTMLSTVDDELYYLRDTHWNNKGALLGGNMLLANLGHDVVQVPDSAWVERNDYTGDIAKMLYPTRPGSELAPYTLGYNDGADQTGALWQWTVGASVEEDFVATCSLDEGTGTLVMFRDSFANALIPYYATTFDQAFFTKLVPYDAATISVEKADYVIVERAERHLAFLGQNAPIMPAPAVKLATNLPAQDTVLGSQTSMQCVEDGGYTIISGELDEGLQHENVDIYLEVPLAEGGSRIYEASYISAYIPEGKNADAENEKATSSAIMQVETDYGFVVYLPGSPLRDGQAVRVICMSGGELMAVTSFRVG